MNAHNTGVCREAFFVIGNLLTTLSCTNLAQILDDFPGLLESFVTDGLQKFINHEKALNNLLSTIAILLNKFPPQYSPLDVQKML